MMGSKTESKNYLFDCHQETTVLDFSNFWNFRWLWSVYGFQSNEVTPIFLNHAKLYVLVLLPTNYSPSLSFLQRFDKSLIENDLGQLRGGHELESKVKTFLIVPCDQKHHWESYHLQVHLILVWADSSKPGIQILFHEPA